VTQKNKGFTLIEIAMVLIIIGLIIGGIVVGSTLIRIAQIRMQIKQIESYKTALFAFQDKYGGLPGDLANPDRFFPPMAGVAAGNGNGNIEFTGDNYYDAGVLWDTQGDEVRRVFVQLSTAGLIEGHYDGSRYLGLGIPKLKHNETAGFFIGSAANFRVGSSGRSPDNTINYRRGTNALWFVACNASTGNSYVAPSATTPFGNIMYDWDDFCGIFSPPDLASMDQKMDDGQPLSGQLLGFGGHDTNPTPTTNLCLNNPTLPTATYRSTDSSKQCQAAYVIN
jgi:prepilin-type N-terminal cleavage/methylation domain-containing protein